MIYSLILSLILLLIHSLIVDYIAYEYILGNNVIQHDLLVLNVMNLRE